MERILVFLMYLDTWFESVSAAFMHNLMSRIKVQLRKSRFELEVKVSSLSLFLKLTLYRLLFFFYLTSDVKLELVC